MDEYETKQNSHRIRALLLEMEKQSKDHIQEVNRVHEHYQVYVSKSQELEQKCKCLQRDTDNAIKSERAVRRELKRMQLQNETLMKRLSSKDFKSFGMSQKFHGDAFITQIQDLISDSNKDFVIGSSSVIINESDNGTNMMPAMSNPLSNSQHRGEMPPPIVSGQCDAKDMEEIQKLKN